MDTQSKTSEFPHSLARFLEAPRTANSIMRARLRAIQADLKTHFRKRFQKRDIETGNQCAVGQDVDRIMAPALIEEVLKKWAQHRAQEGFTTADEKLRLKTQSADERVVLIKNPAPVRKGKGPFIAMMGMVAVGAPEITRVSDVDLDR